MKHFYRVEVCKVAKSGAFSWIEYQQILRLDYNEAQRLIRVLKEAMKQARLDEDFLTYKEMEERNKLTEVEKK